ncbi:MAG: hypothetical protein K0R65_2375 [Crocinitomicaceae bacterium]|jgi:OOP family OmpA-OmpF porin|nr:hypothetical protein [Crocinitomicaceae bacterium]
MNFRLLLLTYILAFNAFSQLTPANRLSIDANIGVTKALYPLSPDFKTNALNPISASAGCRFMLNDLFGLKGEFSLNYFKFTKDNPTPADTGLFLESFYYRTSLVGVTNLGNLLNFKSHTDKFGLLLHTGAGFSILQSDKTLKHVTWKDDFSDIMINITLGLSPQYKIGPRMAVNLDLLAITHLFQTFTFDMNTAGNRPGFDGIILNLSGGISYYLGRHQQHFDWTKRL